MGISSKDDNCLENEKPRHEVTLDAFLMKNYEVRIREYQACVTSGICRSLNIGQDYPGKDGADRPVAGVSWNDAAAYCKWKGGRLPTEAEWEYAARAGTKMARYGKLDQIAWHHENRKESTKTSDIAYRVGLKQPNAWGLYDMLGNVSEWCLDAYSKDYYSRTPQNNPVNQTNSSSYVVRGGGFGTGRDLMRASYRFGLSPDYRDNAIGFRCVRDVKKTETP